MDSNTDSQIKKLENELMEKEKKIEKLNKNIQSEKSWLKKIFWPIVIVVLSVMFLNKLSNAEKQLELKEQHIDKLTKELELMGNKMIKLNNELKLKVPEINKLKEESKLKDEEINKLMNNLKLRDPEIDSLTKDVDLKDEEIDNLTQKLELKTEEYDKLLKSSYMVALLVGAREGSSEILYSTDEEKANLIISVARDTLAENIASCYTTNPEFDVYRTCFRDLSVFFHNKLEHRFGPTWVVTTGRVAYCFTITTINTKKEEYFFKIGDIFFEVFKYVDDVMAQQDVEETFLDYEDDQNVANVSTVENIVMETESEKISDVPQKVKENNVVKDQKIEKSQNVQKEEEKKIN